MANLKDMGTPGAELENIMYLRNVADADEILKVVEKLHKDGGKVSKMENDDSDKVNALMVDIILNKRRGDAVMDCKIVIAVSDNNAKSPKQ